MTLYVDQMVLESKTSLTHIVMPQQLSRRNQLQDATDSETSKLLRLSITSAGLCTV